MSAAVIPFPLLEGNSGKKGNSPIPSPDYVSAIPSALRGIASPHTRRAYETGMRRWLDWLGGEVITADALRGWIGHMQGEGASAATINLRLAAAKRLCNALEESGRLDSPTASRISRLRGRKRAGVRLGNWLTEAQIGELLAADAESLSGKLDRAILALLYGAGLRESEAVALCVEDLVRRDGQWLVSVAHGKGDKPRAFAIHDGAAGLLQSWTAAAGVSSGPILRPVRGDADHMSACAVYRRVRSMGERIGVPELAPHDLRRSCGRHIVENGGSIEQVQLMYGHADVKTTRVYLNLQIDLKDPPAKRLWAMGRENASQ